MASLRVHPDRLEIHLTTAEKTLALRREDLVIPRGNIKSVTITDDPWIWVRGIRAPGALVPLVVAVGVWKFHGGKDFLAIKRRRQAVVIDLIGDDFARVILSTNHAPDLIASLKLEATDAENVPELDGPELEGSAGPESTEATVEESAPAKPAKRAKRVAVAAAATETTVDAAAGSAASPAPVKPAKRTRPATVKAAAPTKPAKAAPARRAQAAGTANAASATDATGATDVAETVEPAAPAAPVKPVKRARPKATPVVVPAAAPVAAPVTLPEATA